MKAIVFDIETRIDADYCDSQDFTDKLLEECSAPANWKDEEKIKAHIDKQFEAKRKKLALSPRTGQIVAIGYGDLNSDDDPDVEYHDEDERGILRNFAAALPPFRAVLAGFNIRGFDLDYVAVRCAIHNVQLPNWWPHARDWRYVADVFTDLFREGKLEFWLDRFGLPPKTASALEVEEMDIEDVANYCANDVAVTRSLLRKVQHVLPALRDNLADDDVPRKPRPTSLTRTVSGMVANMNPWDVFYGNVRYRRVAVRRACFWLSENGRIKSPEDLLLVEDKEILAINGCGPITLHELRRGLARFMSKEKSA